MRANLERAEFLFFPPKVDIRSTKSFDH